jgi:hypothetical protein
MFDFLWRLLQNQVLGAYIFKLLPVDATATTDETPVVALFDRAM